MNREENKNFWALILGASSGFGAASAIKLAEDGYNIFGIHLDRQATMPNVEKIKAQIESFGSNCIFFNVNAADAVKRGEIINEIKTIADGSAIIKILIHSLAIKITFKHIIPESIS